MTSSRSINSKSRLLVLVAALVLWVGTAHAGRKRVVVLDFEGPSAEKFHSDVVKLLKKHHSVVSSDKWNAKAEELGADKVNEKNVKKLAKKLKVDGVVTGKVEKRRDEYIIRLKLRSGTTGEILGNSVQTKADGPKLDSQAKRDIKDELVAAIDELESNRDGGEEEDAAEEEPEKVSKEDKSEEDGGKKESAFSKRKLMEGEDGVKEDKSPRKRDKSEDKGDEEAALETKKTDEEEPRKRSKKRKKDAEEETASSEDGGSVEESADEEGSTDKALNLSPAHRAIDATVGLSFTARRLNFTYAADLGKVPPGYKQSVPVAGALLDVTFFPMAFGHKPNKGIIEGLGISVLYDQIIKINSRKNYPAPSGMNAVADLKTSESRWAIGAVLRYPLGQGPKAVVVGGALTYGKQKFEVAQTLPNNDPTDIPNVNYTMISPTAFIQAPVAPKITIIADAAFHAITDTGAIQTPQQYGASTVTGFELNAGIDYALSTALFVRVAGRYETIGFKFKGDPMSMTHTRDTDPEQDVTGAKDTYFGGTATLGYLY